MGKLPDFRDLAEELRSWRRDLHAHPELAFEEHRTAGIVADKLRAFGLDQVHEGIGKTGVVGVLRGSGDGNRAIGLRADMDALPMTELAERGHASTHDGRMHACGHDGHTVMLLGAARHLAATRGFDGTLYFIFQPAEEGAGGGRAMVEDGLFERFPMEAVFGLHNWPGLPAGEIAVRAGPMMASMDNFRIVVTGKGAHAAMPHLGTDPVLPAAQIVLALQGLVSRETEPTRALVVSVTQIHGGEADNVIPEAVELRGTVRAFDEGVRRHAETAMGRIVASTAAAFGATAELHYSRHYPPTVNSVEETEFAAEIAAEVAGAEGVRRDLPPSMGAEDFAFMLQERPGCYVWLGGGRESRPLHNPYYDFNDEILPVGVRYWTTLAARALPRR